MAVEVHYATLQQYRVSQDGTIYNASNNTKTIKNSLMFTTEWRMVKDDTVPNTVNNPNLKDYLELEAISGFEPVQVNSNFVITKKVV